MTKKKLTIQELISKAHETRGESAPDKKDGKAKDDSKELAKEVTTLQKEVEAKDEALNELNTNNENLEAQLEEQAKALEEMDKAPTWSRLSWPHLKTFAAALGCDVQKNKDKATIEKWLTKNAS